MSAVDPRMFNAASNFSFKTDCCGSKSSFTYPMPTRSGKDEMRPMRFSNSSSC